MQARLVVAMFAILSACTPSSEQTLADPPAKPIAREVPRVPDDIPAVPRSALADRQSDGDPTGRLTVESRDGRPCAVEIDGRRLFADTPVQIADLELGEHVLTLRCPDRATVTKRVMIGRGSRTEVL